MIQIKWRLNSHNFKSRCDRKSRRFTTWAMGSLAPLEANRHIYLKYSRSASFDPYSMSAATLQDYFTELLANGEWIV